MKLHYYEETDSLYIELSSQKSENSDEIKEGIVVDFDSQGNVVGIDIDNASKKMNLESLETVSLPVKSAKLA
jgi:uncharacterized protein YuzE